MIAVAKPTMRPVFVCHNREIVRQTAEVSSDGLSIKWGGFEFSEEELINVTAYTGAVSYAVKRAEMLDWIIFGFSTWEISKRQIEDALDYLRRLERGDIV